MNTDERIADYKRKENEPKAYIGVFLLAIILVFLLSLSASEMQIGFFESFSIIYNHLVGVEPTNYHEMIIDRVVVEQNIPRAIGAICAGAVLAIGGAVLQNLIRNPLADPYTLRISSGALFGMIVSVVLGISVIPFVDQMDGRIVNAFLFALIPTAIIVFLSSFKKVSPTMMILIGIAMMYGFNAFNTIIKYTSDDETISQIYLWTIGSVAGMSWGALPKLLFALILIYLAMYYIRREIDIVAQGDAGAMTLGINPYKLRIIALVIVSFATAIIVCYTGTIGFVGLVAPHIARHYFGSKCRLLIPGSAVIGALMVLISDYIIRILAPSLPVGVVLALVCSPIFIIILVRMKKNEW